jgi:hypothetical protein
MGPKLDSREIHRRHQGPGSILREGQWEGAHPLELEKAVPIE